ncbi:MAG: DUF4234 domain-containing protein [Corallococcus sp.]|nr:DUF4234 domain-containing protein [Corallococcus sp.]
MSKKYQFANGKSKVAATVLAAVSFVMLIGALILFFSVDYQARWLIVPLIVFFIASFALTLCALYADPKFYTLAAVFTALSYVYLLFLVMLRAVDCVAFSDLPEWARITIPVSLSVLFVAFCLTFVLLAARNTKLKTPTKGGPPYVSDTDMSKSKSLTKSVRAIFIVLLVITAVIFGADVASAVLGHYEIISAEVYQSRDISAGEAYYLKYGETAWTYISWTDGGGTDHIAGYDTVGSTAIDVSSGLSDDYSRRAALSQIDNTVNYNDVYFCYDISDATPSGGTSSVKKYIMLEDTTGSYYNPLNTYQLCKLVGQSESKTCSAREVFEMTCGVGLDVTDDYKVVPSSYSYFGFAKEASLYKLSRRSLTIAEVGVSYRIPNVFFLISAVCGIIALYLVSANCQITEKETVVFAAKAAGGGMPSPSALNALRRQKIALNVFLTVITLGIYGYVWFYRNARNVRVLSGENAAGLGDEVALYLFGGLFYGIYWYYSRTKRLSAAIADIYAKRKCLSPTVYLITSILPFGILPLCLISKDINNIISEYDNIIFDNEYEEESEPLHAMFTEGEYEEESEPLHAMFTEGEYEEATEEDEKRYAKSAVLSNRLGIVKTVLLSIVTLGVYYVITLSRVVNRVNVLQGNKQARVGQVVCLFLVPFYWIYWLAKYSDRLEEEGNRTTLECWLVNIIPFYGAYWLLTRANDIADAACEYSVPYHNSAVLSTVSLVLPILGFGVVLATLDRITDNLTLSA